MVYKDSDEYPALVEMCTQLKNLYEITMKKISNIMPIDGINVDIKQKRLQMKMLYCQNGDLH
jgi:hypothetical protein